MVVNFKFSDLNIQKKMSEESVKVQIGNNIGKIAKMSCKSS